MQKTLTKKQTHWFRHVEQYTAAGGTLSRYAEEHSLALKQLYSWRAAYKKYHAKPIKKTSARFVKADIRPPRSNKMNVSIAGIDLSFTELPDPRWLASFCAAASDLS